MSAGKKKRKARQHKRKLYQMIREDLQVSGELPTTPEGSLRPERVDPASQGDGAPALTASMTATALRNGWEVPEDKKPALVDELTKIIEDGDMPSKVKVAAFNALRMADQQQYERDFPERAAKAKGGTTINNANNVGDVFADIHVLEQRYQQITGEGGAEADGAPDGDVRPDGDAQPVDEEEPGRAEEEPEAD